MEGWRGWKCKWSCCWPAEPETKQRGKKTIPSWCSLVKHAVLSFLFLTTQSLIHHITRIIQPMNVETTRKHWKWLLTLQPCLKSIPHPLIHCCLYNKHSIVDSIVSSKLRFQTDFRFMRHFASSLTAAEYRIVSRKSISSIVFLYSAYISHITGTQIKCQKIKCTL